MIVGWSAGRDAPASLRARLALNEAGQREVLRARRDGIAEHAVLATCHRTELYVATDAAGAIEHATSLLPGLQPADLREVRVMHDSEAVEHLSRVASGLDSLVVGEPQVLGQVQRALDLAQQEGAAGPVMTDLFERAIALGRRVRAETALGNLGMSIGSIAADYLLSRMGSLEGRTAVVIGGGEAATDASLALRKAGARLVIMNRTAASAERLATLAGGEMRRLRDLTEVLAHGDMAVVAVSGGVLVRDGDLPTEHRDEPFLILDLSTPRAVDLGTHPGVEVRDLEELPGPSGPEVASAVIEAEALVRHEVALLHDSAGSTGEGRR